MRTYLLLPILALAGCASEDGAEVDTTARGAATYQDSATDANGNPQAPAGPEPQTIEVEIEVEGSGSLEGLETDCLDGLSGNFEGVFAGEAVIDDDGVYLAGMASTAASFVTPGGCDIPTIDIEAVTRVVVHASLTTTEVNCSGYCAAKARSHAEAECGAEPSDATCRAAAEGEYQLSCSAACEVDQNQVVAETELSAAAVAELSARNLSGAALGEIEVDLVFDHIEDAQGSIIVEN